MSLAVADRYHGRPFLDGRGRQHDASSILGWALAASVVVHAAIFFATRPGGAVHGVASLAPRVIEAVLARPEIAADTPTAILSDPSEILAKESTVAPIAPPRPAVPATPVADKPAHKGAARGVASLSVTGEPIVDKSQLGEYFDRQISEFRAEVDRPVRIDEPIVARYPPAALRAGREDSVSVWIVVDHTGQADEIDVIEGSPEFADEVVAAVKAATFLPAEHKLRPIRFPIALEFRFRLGDTHATAQAGGTR